jgi:hypothetical protein
LSTDKATSRLVSWGSQVYGQTGQQSSNSIAMALFSESEFQPLPRSVTAIPDTLSSDLKIACGFFHDLLLDRSKNRLWSWGAGFLGFGDAAYHTYPRMLNGASSSSSLQRSLGYKILDCWASSYYSLVSFIPPDSTTLEYAIWGFLGDASYFSSTWYPESRSSIIKSMWSVLFPSSLQSTPSDLERSSKISCPLSPTRLTMLSGKSFRSIICHPSVIALLPSLSVSNNALKIDLLRPRLKDPRSQPPRPYSPSFIPAYFHNPYIDQIEYQSSISLLDLDSPIHSVHIPWVLPRGSHRSPVILYILTTDNKLLSYDLSDAIGPISPLKRLDICEFSQFLDKTKQVIMISSTLYILDSTGKIYSLKTEENPLVLRTQSSGPWNHMATNSVDMIYAW